MWSLASLTPVRLQAPADQSAFFPSASLDSTPDGCFVSVLTYVTVTGFLCFCFCLYYHYDCNFILVTRYELVVSDYLVNSCMALFCPFLFSFFSLCSILVYSIEVTTVLI